MPNWCENELKVRGSVAEVQRFVRENAGASGEPLSFQSGCPVPPELNNEEAYAWRVTQWGTKWDLGPNTSFKPGTAGKQGTADYGFDTAWAPPSAWLKNVAAKYPRLRFALEYIEPGMGFAGRQKYGEGRLLEHTDLDFKNAYIKRYGKEQWTEMTGESQEDSDE